MHLLKLAPLAAVAVVVACADQGSVGPAGDVSFSHTGDGPGLEQLGHWTLCKEGTDGIFSIEIDGVPAADANRTDGVCASPAQDVTTSPAGGGGVVVMATEQVAANTVVDSIVIDAIFIDFSTSSTKLTSTNTVTTTANGDKGVVVTFYNTFTPPPPGGGEGCTPGFWKNWTGLGPQPNVWPNPPLPGTMFSPLFDDAFPGKTLLEVLELGGGGLNALGRHTVAAYLNALSLSVDYDLTPTQVIDDFNDTFPGTKTDYNALKAIFEGFNTQTSPGFCD